MSELAKSRQNSGRFSKSNENPIKLKAYEIGHLIAWFFLSYRLEFTHISGENNTILPFSKYSNICSDLDLQWFQSHKCSGKLSLSQKLYNNHRRFIQSIKFEQSSWSLSIKLLSRYPFSKPVWSICWQESISSLLLLDIETVVSKYWYFRISILSPIILPSPG